MDLRAVAMGVLFALIWSSAFTSARILVTEAPPVAVAALRFLIAGVVGVAIARAAGQSWRLTAPQWRATVIFGLCQNALYLGLYFVAMQWVEAGFASIIAATLPLLVALFGWLAFGERVPPLGVAGLAAGFAGVAIILGSRISGGADPLGIVLCIIGVLALSVATLTVRGASSGGNLMMVVGLQMLVGGVVLLPFGLAELRPVELNPRFVVAFLYTTFIPGLLATWIWFRLVGRVGAVRAATFHFLNPVFGVGIAALLLGERPGPLDLAGVAVVTLGILAVQLSRQGPVSSRGRPG